MAGITISALTSFFSDEPKSIQRGENHYKSDYIESFQYSHGIIRGSVHASMKNSEIDLWAIHFQLITKMAATNSRTASRTSIFSSKTESFQTHINRHNHTLIDKTIC